MVAPNADADNVLAASSVLKYALTEKSAPIKCHDDSPMIQLISAGTVVRKKEIIV